MEIKRYMDAGDSITGLDLVFPSLLYTHHSQLLWVSLLSFSLKTLAQNSSFCPLNSPTQKFLPFKGWGAHAYIEEWEDRNWQKGSNLARSGSCSKEFLILKC